MTDEPYCECDRCGFVCKSKYSLKQHRTFCPASRGTANSMPPPAYVPYQARNVQRFPDGGKYFHPNILHRDGFE